MPEHLKHDSKPLLLAAEKKTEMTAHLFVHDTWKNKISFCHAACFLVSLPFDRFYSILVLISFLIHGIIHATITDYKAIWNGKTLLLTSTFLVTLIGIAWSTDKTEGFKDLQRQLAILLMPVALQLSGLDLIKYRKKLLHVFGFTCVITILYLFLDAFRIIRYNGLPLTHLFSSSFINHNFSESIGMHATYLSMYVSLSLSAFLIFLMQEKEKKKILLYTVAGLILLAGLIQLASRSVLIATFLFTFIGIPFLSPVKMDRSKYAFIGLCALGVVVLFITGVGPLQKRYVKDFKEDLTVNPAGDEYREPRIDRWKSAVTIFSESPIIGKGSGSEKRLLKEKYYTDKLYTSYLQELNAHNQYLSFALKTGVAGLLVFLITLVTGQIVSIRRKDPVFFSFMTLVAIVSFSENLLDVNKGIFFYAFFFALFLLPGKPLGLFTRLKNTGK